MKITRTLMHAALVALPALAFPALCISEELPLTSIGYASAETKTSTTSGASDKVTIDALDALANNLLKKEIELQQLNEQLHLEAATSDFKRLRRTWLWDFGNAIPTEAGLISATALYYSRAHEKLQKSVQTKTISGKTLYSLQEKKVENHAPASDIANTIIPQIAGQIVGGGGSFFELNVDLAKFRKLRAHRLDRKAITTRVINIEKDIDNFQSQYDKLLSNALEASDVTVYQAEAKLLTDTTQRSLARFISLEARASGISLGQWIEDSVSLTRNTIGTVGNSINVAAVFEGGGNKRFNGYGDILNLIAASMITTRPFMSNIGAYLSKKQNKAREKRDFPLLDQSAKLRLKSDFDQLQLASQATTITPQMASRLALYEEERRTFGEEDSLSSYEQDKSKQIMIRRFRESLYGPTKMTQSIMGCVVNFRNLDNANADYRLNAAANTIYTSGQAFNMSELVRERIADEKEHTALSKLEMLPEQRIQKNMRRLEQMKSRLK
jgi:hypothetical protein